jgi:hypothetical protein
VIRTDRNRIFLDNTVQTKADRRVASLRSWVHDRAGDEQQNFGYEFVGRSRRERKVMTGKYGEKK